MRIFLAAKSPFRSLGVVGFRMRFSILVWMLIHHSLLFFANNYSKGNMHDLTACPLTVNLGKNKQLEIIKERKGKGRAVLGGHTDNLEIKRN